jgi:hypothetical protein
VRRVYFVVVFILLMSVGIGIAMPAWNQVKTPGFWSQNWLEAGLSLLPAFF